MARAKEMGLNASFLAIQGLDGLTSASILFITACGLTLVFGVTRIVNFAHGSFYMLGAYLAATMIPHLMATLDPTAGFWAGILLSALAVGAIGVLFEILVLRRVYPMAELYQLIATFAAVLIIADMVVIAFGRDDIFGTRAPGLRAPVTILDRRYPSYDLFLILAGPAVLLALTALLKLTRFGALIRAATQDREMVGALGVNQSLLFTGVLFLGSFLAGLGGALQTPRLPANPQMDLSVITECFVVTVIGGMGSIPGAFVAALLIGELQAFGILVLPKVTLALVFVLMAVVLVVRPWGFFGRPEAPVAVRAGGALTTRWGLAPWMMVGGLLLALAVLPWLSDDYFLRVVTEVMVMSLFAASLHLLVVTGGLVSFGHAAYFGLGAYGAALVVKHLGAPMELALLAAPLLALLGAALFGFFIVRLEGTYLAMLSLAAAQIVYAVAFQWTDLTGGDNGMIGIWPAHWASGQRAYYYLVLAVVTLAILALRHLSEAPFGYALRAARDSAVRADAVGIDVRAHRWIAFTIAGAAAGLAGGLLTFMNGSVDPTVLSVQMSVDGLMMLLLGGLQTMAGAVVGAVTLHALKSTFIAVTDYWRLFTGLAILALVLLLPRGIMGALQRLSQRLRSGLARRPLGKSGLGVREAGMSDVAAPGTSE